MRQLKEWNRGAWALALAGALLSPTAAHVAAGPRMADLAAAQPIAAGQGIVNMADGYTFDPAALVGADLRLPVRNAGEGDGVDGFAVAGTRLVTLDALRALPFPPYVMGEIRGTEAAPGQIQVELTMNGRAPVSLHAFIAPLPGGAGYAVAAFGAYAEAASTDLANPVDVLQLLGLESGENVVALSVTAPDVSWSETRTLVAGPVVDATSCAAGRVTNVTTTMRTRGYGCSKPTATQAALDLVGTTYCVGNDDPLCAGTCSSPQACSRTATHNTGLTACAKFYLAGCSQGHGYACEVIGGFTCRCRCR